MFTIKNTIIVMNSGIISTDGCLRLIIPLYKQKGSRDDPNNYRGITLLRCLGKLFTASLNCRINDFFNAIGLLGERSATVLCLYCVQ